MVRRVEQERPGIADIIAREHKLLKHAYELIEKHYAQDAHKLVDSLLQDSGIDISDVARICRFATAPSINIEHFDIPHNSKKHDEVFKQPLEWRMASKRWHEEKTLLVEATHAYAAMQLASFLEPGLGAAWQKAQGDVFMAMQNQLGALRSEAQYTDANGAPLTPAAAVTNIRYDYFVYDDNATILDFPPEIRHAHMRDYAQKGNPSILLNRRMPPSDAPPGKKEYNVLGIYSENPNGFLLLNQMMCDVIGQCEATRPHWMDKVKKHVGVALSQAYPTGRMHP